MRDIKFRIYDKLSGKIIYITGFRYVNNRIKYTFIDRDGDTCTYTRGRSEIEIMQYTGLHDRNGKEIYEGDLVIIPAEDEQEAVKIEWDNDSSRFVFSARTYTCDFDSYGGEDCEVVGNIYDNFEQDELQHWNRKYR